MFLAVNEFPSPENMDMLMLTLIIMFKVAALFDQSYWTAHIVRVARSSLSLIYVTYKFWYSFKLVFITNIRDIQVLIQFQVSVTLLLIL